MLMIKRYILKPIMTLNSLTTTSDPGKPGNGLTERIPPLRARLRFASAALRAVNASLKNT